MVLQDQKQTGASDASSEGSGIAEVGAPMRSDAGTAASGRLLARDRLSAGVRISVELEPLDVPDRADVVAAVRTLIGFGSSARAGRMFDGDSWRYAPDELDRQAERMVKELPLHLTGDAGLPRLRDAADPDLPFTVFLGTDRASLCIDHRLGDGFLSVMLTAGVLAGKGVPSVFASADDRDPLRAALAATFGRHPARVAALVDSRRHDARSEYVGPTVSAQRGSLDLVTTIMEPQTFRALASWSRGRVPPTLAMMFALRAALERVGVPVMDEGAILVDLRRYLPSGRSTLANFVVGQPVSVMGGVDAAGARFTRDLHVGRPLAALTVGLLSQPWRRASTSDIAAAAYPIVSDMGFLRALEPLPWATETPTVRVSVDPAARNGITALTAVLRRRMNVSVSFDSSLFDRGKVEQACELLCRDPKGLLP
ncbi:hypothetical protein SAMN04487846_1399 [Microbacterium sp. cf046]|uniref:hypothetical protein n=1 Tax=Microbacterium sp. cf046 TaxID=1761803 RepID=UPI0008DEC7ED|nr:hypothetical protein [Microbacterium sp. cf046]SFS00675.1 hypothetical protein SAMN04487846_1399 [Microbacterium sp. cf046]